MQSGHFPDCGWRGSWESAPSTLWFQKVGVCALVSSTELTLPPGEGGLSAPAELLRGLRIICSPWGWMKGPWLCWMSKLVSVSLDLFLLLFIFLLHFLISLIGLILWLKLFYRNRQVEDMCGGLFWEGPIAQGPARLYCHNQVPLSGLNNRNLLCHSFGA